ncbi:MAG TPA: squalene synthase HpnC [Magnetospirillaceae bacterium]|jgi:farnesyl-diphosphate farnesyltransferase
MSTVEHPSGKDRAGENFPVGSWLIKKPLRPHVYAFYRFARNADDIADASDLSPDEKLRRLDRIAAVLDGAPGDDAPTASGARAMLAETGVPPVHCHDLLNAFRQDATKLRYADWDDLMAYCRLSAAPVGRFLLDLHGESRDTWPASDALCSALQVINHLQDCAEDYRTLNRVYLPEDLLAVSGIDVTALAASASSPALRRVLDKMLRLTRPLVAQSRALPGSIKSTGLRRESAVIVSLADRLVALLARRDPLAERVKLGPVGMIMAALSGLLGIQDRAA